MINCFLLQDDNVDLSFLKEIREVTGYVLISHVNVRRIVLPNLMIIRGRNLFKLNPGDDEFALLVAKNTIEILELPALRGLLMTITISNINTKNITSINMYYLIIVNLREKFVVIFKNL